MQPIPQTLQAIDELDAYLDEGSLLDELKRSADLAQQIAPGLAGVSIASKASSGVTFTLVASDEEIASLDGVQYLTSGPCVEVVDGGQGVATTSADLMSEPRWHAFGQATAAAGVRSTLTFPIVHGHQVTGTVNLYGRSDDTFQGRHQALATVFRAWAPGAVTNADLSFSTRRAAEQAPEVLRLDALIDTATGLLSSMSDLTIDQARSKLAVAATRAGVPEANIAQAVIDLHNTRFGHAG